MMEWGPAKVTEAEIRMMKEDVLVLEEVLAVGWHPPTTGELAPVPKD